MVPHLRFRRDSVEMLREELSNGHISRRDFLRTSALLGVTAATAGLPFGDAQAAESITICNYGGPLVDTMKEALAAPFTAESGVGVEFDTSGPILGRVKKMVDDGAAIWDLIDGGPNYGLTGDSGKYFEPIDYSVVDKSRLFDWVYNDYAVGSYVYSNVLTYDSAKLKEAPTSWVDFFDLEKFPGKRVLYKWFDGAPEACLLGAGVAPDKLYPIDWDIVAQQVERLGDNLVLWDSGAMSMQVFLDEEVVMGNIWNTRARLLERDTQGRIKWTWNQQIVAPATWLIPKGSKHVAAAQKFIASAQAPDRQVKLLDASGNGPANPAALDLLTEEQKRINPTSHLEGAVIEDMQWYADNYDDAVDTWSSITTR